MEIFLFMLIIVLNRHTHVFDSLTEVKPLRQPLEMQIDPARARLCQPGDEETICSEEKLT